MTIKEISQRFNLTQDTLRYYERIGLIPPVPRNSSGNREYDEESCRWIEFIKCMRSSGLPIEILIEYVTLFQKGDETVVARKELLVEQRNQLLVKIKELQATVERLNGKIERYDNQLLEIEKGLRK